MQMWNKPWMPLLLLALFASKASGYEGASILVLYGPGGPDPSLEQRALAAYNLQAEGASPHIRHVGTALSTMADVEVLGAAEAATCPGSPMSADTFVSEIEQAFQLVAYVQVEQATRALDRLESLLPCLNETFPRAELARISYLKGVVLALGGRDDDAREAFRRALVVCPELDWDATFPPDPEAIFVDAIQDALRTPAAPLIVEPRLGTTLWVDGEPIPPGGSTTSMAEGRHLLQWTTEAGGFHTLALAVRGGEPVTVLGRQDAATALITGRGSPAALDRAATALEALAEGVGADGIYLADLQSVDLLHKFDPADRTWQLTDSGVVAHRQRQKRQTDVGRGVLISGSVLAGVGAAIGISGYVVAKGLYDERENLDGSTDYAATATEYSNARTQAIVGLSMAGVGSAVMIAGIPILVTAKGQRQGVASVSASIHFTPTGAALTGRF